MNSHSHSNAEPGAMVSMTAEDVQELQAYRSWIPRIKAVCQAAAYGDLEPRLLRRNVGGELGETLVAINTMLDLTDAFVREASAALEYASNGKYFRKVLEAGLLGSFLRGADVINAASNAMSLNNDALIEIRKRQLALADEFESTIQAVVENVAGAAHELEGTAQTLSAAAEETTVQANSVAQSITIATEGLDAIADSSGELSKAVGDITKQVAGAFNVTQEAVCESTEATDRAVRLTASSESIGSVMHLIRQVAEQTNLLALNATIEAARAGDAGRGFAVVASEVKDLSAETGRATEVIEGHVTEIGTETIAMQKSINLVSETLGRLDEISSTIAAAMEEQDAVTSEVTSNTARAANSAREVMNTIEGVRQASEDTARSSVHVLSSATDLTGASGTLMEAVEGFLAELREG